MICLNHFLFHYLKKKPSSQRHSSTSNGRVLMVIGINSTLGEKRSGNVFYLILLEITLQRKLCSDYPCWPLQSGIDDQRGTGGFLFYTSPVLSIWSRSSWSFPSHAGHRCPVIESSQSVPGGIFFYNSFLCSVIYRIVIRFSRWSCYRIRHLGAFGILIERTSIYDGSRLDSMEIEVSCMLLLSQELRKALFI